MRARDELAEATAPTGAAPAETAPHKLRAPGLLELEELFSQFLDTRVSVTAGPKRGRVVIDFADLEDLERIYRRITGPEQTLNS